MFSLKEQQELMLVFDIRSSSVGGALFKVQKSGIPKIIFSVRESVPQEETVNVDKFLLSTMKSLDVVVSKIFKASLGVPKSIFCVLASPWYVSQTRIIHLKKDKPFTFNLALADDLIKREMSQFKEEHLEKYVKTKQEIQVIELKNIKTMLNGYETHNPLDQKTEEVEMTLFVSMSPGQILSNIENVVNKYFHHETVKFSSFSFVSFTAIHNMFLDQPNFLLIDVGGELTDVSMIKKNVFSESISFPLGRHFIIRGIAEAMSCTPSEAESYVSLLHDGHADPSTEKKILPLINKLKTEWLSKFQESLANLSKDISVPFTIYLSADPDFIHFFGEVIEAEQFNQYTLTESKFKIIFMDTETLHGIVEFSKDTPRDPFIMVDAAYINHSLTYSEKSSTI